MNVTDIIARKRDGVVLTRKEMEFLIFGYLKNRVPDYQVAAWLMAVYLQGMTVQETVELTEVMVASGERLDWSGKGLMVVDKHSTGGVGDKTTLVLAPMLAGAGLAVAKMSGRTLGHTGGTIDKLESIPGFAVDLEPAEFTARVKKNGLCLCGHSPRLVPADARLYALRDVTATVGSLPLIAASIMSKKLASGAQALVLDVKAGRGALTGSEGESWELARLMVEIGRCLGLKTTAVISSMNQPLGQAVGNALEVAEAIQTLACGEPSDLLNLCLSLGEPLLVGAGRAATAQEARKVLMQTIETGAALKKFRALVADQGGDPKVVDDPWSVLQRAPVTRTVVAPRTGYVEGIDCLAVARTVMSLGAGRKVKGEPIDRSVGVLLKVKVGARVEKGQPLAEVHARSDGEAAAGIEGILEAYRIGPDPVTPEPLVLGVIS